MSFNSKKFVLILSFTDHRRDPRVHRQIEALKHVYSLTTAGTCPETSQGTRHIELIRQRNPFFKQIKIAVWLKTRQYETRYWAQPIVRQAYQKLLEHRFDVIVANDLETLPLALKLAKEKGSKVYFDAHEYSPKEFDGEFSFDFFLADYHDYLCKTYLPVVDYMTTVCPGIAEEYKKQYGVQCDVIMNTPEYADFMPQPVSKNRFRIIHHGGVNKARKIENMIRMVGEDLADKFDMDLMLVNNNDEVMKVLCNEAKKYPNINIIDSVPMQDIAQTLNRYDIGLYMLPPVSFNNNLALPNKLFEFIQGRLSIAIWPSPEMKRIVDQHQLGVVSDDFTIEAMVEKLGSLTAADLSRYKENSHKAALIYNSENNARHLQSIIAKL